MQIPDSFLIAAHDLAASSPLPVMLLADADVVHAQFARAIADEIAANNRQGTITRLILPVGPVGQYPLLAALCNLEQISWRNCHLFFMDEYCDWQGRRVDASHHASFQGIAQRELFARLAADLAPPTEQIYFPDPLHIDDISRRIADIGGIDTCYGGIGIHGHVAFNEAPISRWYTLSLAEFKQSRTRLLQLADETMVLNASRALGGYFPALPPMAVTLGMADIAAARRIRLYCQGGAWQRAILRIALFGSPGVPGGEDVRYPVTLLRDHADIAIVADQASAQPPVV